MDSATASKRPLRTGWREILLKKAIETLGRACIVQRLNVPGFMLDDWLEGNPPMPPWKVSILLDLVEGNAADRRSANCESLHHVRSQSNPLTQSREPRAR